MTLYRKVAQCRVCQSSCGRDIDQALLNRRPFRVIIELFGAKFPSERPLTVKNLQRHWKHLREAINTAAIQHLLDQTSSPPFVPAPLAEQREPHALDRQEVFEAAVKDRINEIEMMEELMVSGMTDLRRIQYRDDEDEFMILKRDRVRRNTAAIVLDSAKIKQMAVQADEDRQRLEKGRLIFRMFQLFAKSLEACPVDYRSVVAAQLKDVIRRDDEINALLREQASGPSIPATAGE